MGQRSNDVKLQKRENISEVTDSQQGKASK